MKTGEDNVHPDSGLLTSLATHALFIGIIFILPEALLRVAIPGRTLDITWPMYVKSIITIGVFYINYFIVIPKTLNQSPSKRWKFLVWNILIVALGSISIWFTYKYLYNGPNLPMRGMTRNSSLAAISYIVRDSIMLILSISLAVALRVSRRWLDLERRHQKLTAIRREAELDSLRSQLNPHFLFNTLNAIYALIEISPGKAQKAVHDLSGLLRYIVYENPRTVLLDQEVEFVKNFVELIKLRMSNRPISLEIDRKNDSDVEIAPLIFLNLIGNAFKHGNLPDQTLPIDINIISDGTQVRCITKNHFIEDSDKENSTGVGMSILKRRLELIYGHNASVKTEKHGDLYLAELIIKL